MKKYQLKTIAIVSLMAFTSMANATNGSKPKPPAQAESKQSNTPVAPDKVSFWEWLQQYFAI